jgi:hypothetical protein
MTVEPDVDTGLDAGPDEFDLDLRLGELAAWHPGHPTHLLGGAPLVDAQSDGNCLPTGGRGWGPTCNTQNNTCPQTCAGRDTCPNTACNTCQATCAGHQTCPQTNCATCANTCGNTCAFTCGRCNTNSCQGGNCQPP